MKHTITLTALLLAPLAAPCAATAPQTAVSIVGNDFHINGKPTYAGRVWNGHRIEGLLMNSRMVQGVFDDLNPETVSRWAYPDTKKWGADRNTREFVAAMPEWKAHGLLAVTVNFQGGSPEGYSHAQPWITGAFNEEGSLRPDFAARMKRVLDAADANGMVVILGYFYFGQDQHLKDEAAVLRATDEATRWLLDGNWRNVIVEVNNECNVNAYDHAILRPDRIHELIARVRQAEKNGRRLLAGTSYGGGGIPKENVVRVSDFLLLHGNGVKDPKRIAQMVQKARAVPGYRHMPILFNEDDHEDFDQPENNFAAAVAEHASWGWFDFRRRGEGFEQGYQSPPVNWSISSPRKRAFFDYLGAITTEAIAPAVAGSLDLTNDPATGGPGKFAAEEIRREANAKGMTLGDDASTTRVELTVGKEGAAQSYSIRVKNDGGRRVIMVRGADATGAMYGGLDVAEALRTGALASLKDSAHAPHIAQRGIKMNIPLDLRTPSYTDPSDAAQANIPEMWSMDFWRELFDDMARHRYNVISLWSLNPFPSIVKVPEFPHVALEDVWRTTMKLDANFDGNGNNFVKPEMLAQHEVVKKITIDEKIEFWREVMQRAKDRGIEMYWFTWNTFLFGMEGKDGITGEKTAPHTIEYFRASVRETIKTYPLLAGLGITAGEGMPPKDFKDLAKEQWLWRTYGEGIRDGLRDTPARKFRLIHRFHMTGLSDIQNAFSELPCTLDLSFKYAIAHMYSVPNPSMIQPVLPLLSPKLRCWLTVRNDDIYSFRWADADYARAFIKAIPGEDKIAGFYMGSDGYLWGRDFLSKDAGTPRQTVMQKQWLSFALWGRLAYEPDLSAATFDRLAAARFHGADIPQLAAAWAAASRTFPYITRFFWGDIDVKWFPEACRRKSGFYTVRDFVEGGTMPGAGVLNIIEWRTGLLAKQKPEGVTPLEIAASLDANATQALQALPELQRAAVTPAASAKEYAATLGDIEAMAHLGRYYAAKIRGACDLALFDKTGDAQQQAFAIEHLAASLNHWGKYAAAYTRQNVQPVLYNRAGVVDIPQQTADVAADVQLARDWKPGMIAEHKLKRSRTEAGFKE